MILNHLAQCHLGAQLCLCIFWYWGSNSEFLWWQRSINDAKNETFLPLFLWSLLSCFWLSSAAMAGFCQFFPLFLHCRLCIWIFSCLRHRNESVHKTAMSFSICPFCSNVILMRFVASSFLPWSRAFIGINNTIIFRLAFPNVAVGFSTALYRFFARPCCWHWNFQLSASGFHRELEFFVVWLSEEYSSQFSGIVKPWFLDSPSLFGFPFCCIRHMLPHIWLYIVGSWGCLFPRQSQDHVYHSSDLSLNIRNLVKPVHASDNSFSIHVPVINLFFQQYVQWCLCWSGNVDLLHRNRKWFCFRHVQFYSGFHVMAISEISRNNRPEVIFCFSTVPRWVILKRGWRREFVWFSSENLLFLSSFRTIPD